MHENVLDITNHQESANQNRNEIAHFRMSAIKKTNSSKCREDVEKREAFFALMVGM